MKQSVVLPPQLWFLLQAKKRYKVAHGGRASAKSTSYVKALIVKACETRIRVLCTREIQNSIKESVYRLLKDQIIALSVDDQFDFTLSEIINKRNGSQFIFYGLKTNTDKIKSLEGVDICYVEEADKISDESWEILIPTIRKEGSEIWIVFNDNSEEDPVYKRFVVNQPPDCIVCKINYTDVPREWLSSEILAEAEYCKSSDPSAYDRIWLGNPSGGGGRVWTTYDDNTHVRDFDWEETRIRANCYMAMDPHSKYFPFCVWVAEFPADAQGRTTISWIYNEWPTFDMFYKYYSDIRDEKMFSEWGSIRDLAREIMIKDGSEYGIKVLKRYIDTRYAKAGGGENWSTSTIGIIQEFSNPANGGLHFNMPPERIIDVQREKMLDKMRYNKVQGLSEFNQPSLYVAPWCANVRQSLKFHKLEEKSEKEHPKYKDPSDALRICFAGMSMNEWKAERNEKVQRAMVPTFEVAYSGVASNTLAWMS